jgi:Flp pilus assembly pilin Flp
MLRRQDGQTMVEYSLALTMILIVTVVAFTFLGDAASALVGHVVYAFHAL